MKIRNLENVPLPEIVEALLAAFAGYFVPMPADVSYWETRFKAAGVDWALSFGAFENEKLIGFIIHGIGYHNGLKTAFNTGTGVIPAFRDQHVVSLLYNDALPLLQQNGVEKCLLEVITKNDKAIRVYEKNGFQIVRKLHCFRGTLTAEPENISLTKTDTETLLRATQNSQYAYSWDHTADALLRISSNYAAYTFSRSGEPPAGYFIINPQTNYLAQIELNDPDNKTDWDLALAGVALLSRNVRINNVDENRTAANAALLRNGLENFLDQFEMEMLL